MHERQTIAVHDSRLLLVFVCANTAERIDVLLAVETLEDSRNTVARHLKFYVHIDVWGLLQKPAKVGRMV